MRMTRGHIALRRPGFEIGALLYSSLSVFCSAFLALLIVAKSNDLGAQIGLCEQVIAPGVAVLLPVV